METAKTYIIVILLIAVSVMGVIIYSMTKDSSVEDKVKRAKIEERIRLRNEYDKHLKGLEIIIKQQGDSLKNVREKEKTVYIEIEKQEADEINGLRFITPDSLSRFLSAGLSFDPSNRR